MNNGAMRLFIDFYTFTFFYIHLHFFTFKEDCSPIEKCLNDGKTVIVSLSQKNYDALCSFSFNLGLGALKKSTLLKCLNAGNYDDAAKEFLKWCKDNGKFIEGLHKRRVAESTVFKGGEYTKP